MCHVSKFHKILGSNYTRLGLSIYVKFSLGKWLGTRQKIIQNRSQKTADGRKIRTFSLGRKNNIVIKQK